MTRFEIDFAEHAGSVDEVLLAAHGAVFWLVFSAGERGFPPFDAPLEEAIKRFGLPPQANLDLWRVCAAIDRQGQSWTGKKLEIPAYQSVAAEVRRARERTKADDNAAGARESDTPATTSEEPVGPDEAVGKASNGADEPNPQPRLTGA